ncbi:hypothetical protein E2C01_057875 [Portunus trituberculatus]|uniref:Uncharacterized protein n=1 Tax=Portunus trituberculatus TaxID=210409 RepID=A0A5B7GY60_PORTR|nr:hypothetical protein [Portunus trituberculatus]
MFNSFSIKRLKLVNVAVLTRSTLVSAHLKTLPQSIRPKVTASVKLLYLGHYLWSRGAPRVGPLIAKKKRILQVLFFHTALREAKAVRYLGSRNEGSSPPFLDAASRQQQQQQLVSPTEGIAT